MRYDATAARPPWSALPPSVRSLVADRLGGPVAEVRVAGGGFTRGFAGLLTSRSGERAFVKASDIDYLVDAYRREAVVTAALPAGVPAPRARWTASVDGWFVICLDPVEGRIPELPWSSADLSAALDAWAVAAASLPEIGLELPPFAVGAFTTWGEIAAHRAPLPRVPRYALAHLDELGALERRLVSLASLPSVMHGDLRLDNVLIDGSGRAWLCDWNHICRGPAWLDTITLLITAHGSGFDAGALFAAHPTAIPAPGDALAAGLAAIAGLCLVRAGLPSEASPLIAAHQQWTGEVALDWLASLRGWSPPGPPG